MAIQFIVGGRGVVGREVARYAWSAGEENVLRIEAAASPNPGLCAIETAARPFLLQHQSCY